jgi:hypothetical protein
MGLKSSLLYIRTLCVCVCVCVCVCEREREKGRNGILEIDRYNC